MTQETDLKRKKPLQKRAKDTIDTIFEATAQLLEGDRGHKISTNKIAERAGYSIGTLYQYFPNKNALLVAMARHERERAKKKIEKALENIDHEPLEIIVRRVVQVLLGAFKGRQKLRKHLIMAVVNSDNMTPFLAAQDEIVDFLLQKIRETSRDDLRDPDPFIGYVMSRSLMGVIRSAVLEESKEWQNPRLEDELVALLSRYLRKND